MTIAEIRARLAAGVTPRDIARDTLARIAAWNDPALFITLRDEGALLEEAGRLPPGPLHGVPFVVKDNIDVAGLPTTAACPDFAHVAEADAPAVARLRATGALLLGKVNLDQFATGLNGTRSPYGTPRNARDAALIPGGSSSGSASAVAAGIAAFSLGTDTAGSGRVPAMAQGIVGLKPSLGLVPTRGVVPACRSLDCVSVFAHSVAEAAEVLGVIAGPDDTEPYSRPLPASWRAAAPCPPRFRLAVPQEAQLVFDEGAEDFAAVATRAKELGAEILRVDIAPLLDVARRLYDGAWVAERTAALRGWVTERPTSLHPVTRAILEGGLGRLAVDAFDDFHAAAEARLLARRLFEGADALLLPTAPGIPTVEAMLADPVGANSRLGTYTNFVNLCDLSAIAIPAGAGVTLVGSAFAEGRICGIAASLLDEALPVPEAAPGEAALFCIGAHMSGLPLNGQVTALGGRFLREARTTPEYRLFDLGGRPGMLRDPDGEAITGEIWALPQAAIGPLLAAVPPPLGFGTVRLADGSNVLGFLAEAEGVQGAPEITSFGGWRAFLAKRAA
ncbi:allophanate hydrolase [Sabulicella rubraurantiaca]|uniref:allophanate hydrolase n=1 Tax=Sabulicella rubraurantiaca TaxID=2811429 RepID=UPI001A97609C|nr:allophanate hydrolase [Sabulicella rubraurantiaca]